MNHVSGTTAVTIVILAAAVASCRSDDDVGENANASVGTQSEARGDRTGSDKHVHTPNSMREWQINGKVFREVQSMGGYSNNPLGDCSEWDHGKPGAVGTRDNRCRCSMLQLPDGTWQRDAMAWDWGKIGDNPILTVVEVDPRIYVAREHSVDLWDDEKGLIEAFRVSVKEGEQTWINPVNFHGNNGKSYFVVYSKRTFNGLLALSGEKCVVLPYEGARKGKVLLVHSSRDLNKHQLYLDDLSGGPLQRTVFDSGREEFVDP